ncbi:TetR-family transcription regulator [Kutzneria albida DSM 43870]|uniref:TetR-family transcription regulator n=1 Tax=Kutzneria albida DSM 43870 TaxID=1449976 RepID=W5WBB9_9PSEU|nr:TetR-family transcription regulator [Kutzneria albida DSM 43870]
MYSQPVDTRDKLIESTRELLWERGYVGTSPKAIQALSGVGQGSMYHHFSGKPELALAALRRSAELLRAEAERSLLGPGTAVERVTGYLRREREVLRGCRIGRMAQDPEVIADPQLRAPLAETFDWLRETITTVLAEGRSRGEVAPDLVPETTAATVLAVVQGGYVLARSADSAEPFRQAVDGLIALISR